MGWDVCLSLSVSLLPPSCSTCPPAKCSAALEGLQASGDPRALQEINGTGEGKMGPASSFPQTQGIGERPGAEAFSPGPVLWRLPSPLPTARCFGKTWVWMPVGQMPMLPCISSGTLAEFLRSLILTVLMCFGDINSTY